MRVINPFYGPASGSMYITSQGQGMVAPPSIGIENAGVGVITSSGEFAVPIANNNVTFSGTSLKFDVSEVSCFACFILLPFGAFEAIGMTDAAAYRRAHSRKLECL